MSTNPASSAASRFSTVTAITTPLKFFALALLIVEPMIAILSINASQELLYTLAYLATFMFVLVVLMVVLIVFLAPDALTAKTPSELFNRTRSITQKLVRTQQRAMAKQLISPETDLQKLIAETEISEEEPIVRQQPRNEGGA